jgi:anti-sigma-K factor RskA
MTRDTGSWSRTHRWRAGAIVSVSVVLLALALTACSGVPTGRYIVPAGSTRSTTSS